MMYHEHAVRYMMYSMCMVSHMHVMLETQCIHYKHIVECADKPWTPANIGVLLAPTISSTCFPKHM